MSIVYVYTLCHPATMEVRYVGVTRFPESRQKSHCRPCKTMKGRWVQSLRADKLKPKLIVIEEVPEAEWQEREQYWIAEYRRRGARLTNGDEGGLNRLRHSEELKRKISETLIGRPNLALSKLVYAYDGITGAPLAIYPSGAAAAASCGVDRPNIVRAIRCQTKCGGVFWSYAQMEKFLPERYAAGFYAPSSETRALLSAASLGRGLGRVVSDETRARMSHSARNRQC